MFKLVKVEFLKRIDLRAKVFTLFLLSYGIFIYTNIYFTINHIDILTNIYAFSIILLESIPFAFSILAGLAVSI